MCGIAGLFLKNPKLRTNLGRMVSEMMIELGDRGPDSAGLAVYREQSNNQDNQDNQRVTLVDDTLTDRLTDALANNLADNTSREWISELEKSLDTKVTTTMRASHLVIELSADISAVLTWLRENRPGARVVSAGENIEIYKEAGLPVDVLRRLEAHTLDGTHAVGHTRMATESAVTTEHSHPFSSGLDLCLVHNGSLSNHNRLRRRLQRQGIVFETDNDSEVAAGYLTWRLREGDTVATALEGALSELDGFYTFAVGSRDGFSVLRDPIACKPAVLAETDDWVAMSSEYRAIATLPGAVDANVWEPEPGHVYNWSLDSEAA